jgi:hypothetical protein
VLVVLPNGGQDFVPVHQKKKAGTITKCFSFQLSGFTKAVFVFVANFHNFVKIIFQKEDSVSNSLFLEKKTQKYEQIVTIAYNVKGCFRFDTFIF